MQRYKNISTAKNVSLRKSRILPPLKLSTELSKRKAINMGTVRGKCPNSLTPQRQTKRWVRDNRPAWQFPHCPLSQLRAQGVGEDARGAGARRPAPSGRRPRPQHGSGNLRPVSSLPGNKRAVGSSQPGRVREAFPTGSPRSRGGRASATSGGAPADRLFVLQSGRRSPSPRRLPRGPHPPHKSPRG